MRVRMLQTHDVTESHPDHGELSLVYPAGSTQDFDDITAAALVRDKKAIAHPETSSRVRMNYSLSEDEISQIVNNANRSGSPVAGGGTFVFRKGDFVHFPNEIADVLLASAPTPVDGQASENPPYAELAIDADADPVAATRDAAIADAIERKQAAAETEARRLEREEQLAAARRAQQDAFVAARKSRQAAGSGRSTPATPTPPSSTPAAAAPSTSTKE